jgi:glycosyltransferase involved in cell wall biosynthesis
MTPCLFYVPDAYSTSGPKLMGRNAAGESFLRGFVTHSKASEFWAQVARPEDGRHFAEAVRALGRTEPVRTIDRRTLGRLAGAGVVYHPGPGIGQHALQRAFFGHGRWSLCGITHTTASAGAMDALAELLTAPVQPWDALICTSTAVRENVRRLLQAQADYLADRLGARRVVLPQFPVIPLGVHAEDFAYGESRRRQAREALGADGQTLVVLFTGRLSFHAKAHPLAMYQALQKAAEASGARVLLVECGWHANEQIAKAFAEAAQLACPSVRVVTLDGRKAEERQTAWAGADVFCSLSDNIQETFGIVPLEAMAAGLPVVVSDWDGYKDTVRDGVDGFRIPTMMPPPGAGGDLALRHALEIDTYDMYCGHTCSLVAVDIDAAADAFDKLFRSAELRRQMGEAGRRRVRETFDWSVIIPRYEALWAQLAELRGAPAKDSKPPAHPWPARMDPFDGFAGYATRTLTPKTVLAPADAEAPAALARVKDFRQLAMVNFAAAVLPTDDEVDAVLGAAAGGPKAAEELVKDIAAKRRPFVLRALAWLVKLGVLRVQ